MSLDEFSVHRGLVSNALCETLSLPQVGAVGGFHADPRAGISQSRPEFANWRPTHRLDPASRCVLFGPHGIFKKLALLANIH